MLLYGPTTRTIGVAIYTLNEDGETVYAAALSSIALLIIILGQLIINRIGKGSRRTESDMPHIELINVTKKFGEVVAVNDLCLGIEKGECFSFLGPSGVREDHDLAHAGRVRRPGRREKSW